jgi:alpha-beta hydrolase superfamily lysophospholipase
VSRWSDAAVWEGEGLRREVFFFPSSRGERLYGALYRAAVPSRADGIVICPSWGVEADRSNRLVHGLAFATARLGGAAFVFHHPGYGDSEGDAAASTMESLTSAAVDAADEAARRAPGLEWTLAGFTFGAAIACLAQRDCSAGCLLLLQPELRPGSYFRELACKAERSGFGKDLERLAFGYPAPQAMLDGANEADAAVEATLARFEGEGFAAVYEAPEQPDLLPGSFERVTVPGVWRFGSRKQPGLSEAALGWLGARSLAVGSGVL